MSVHFIKSQSLLQIVFCHNDIDVDMKPLNMILDKCNYINHIKITMLKQMIFHIVIKILTKRELCNHIVIYFHVLVAITS